MFFAYLIPNWQVILLDFSLWLQSKSLSTRYHLRTQGRKLCDWESISKSSPRNPSKLLPISRWWDPLNRGGQRIIGLAMGLGLDNWANSMGYISSHFKILLWKLIWNLKSYIIVSIVLMRLRERYWLLHRNTFTWKPTMTFNSVSSIPNSDNGCLQVVYDVLSKKRI